MNKTQARRWAKSRARRMEFNPEILEQRDAALWMRMRLADQRSWAETVDQQNRLLYCAQYHTIYEPTVE